MMEESNPTDVNLTASPTTSAASMVTTTPFNAASIKLADFRRRFDVLNTEAKTLVDSKEYITKSWDQEEEINRKVINNSRKLCCQLEILKIDVVECFGIDTDKLDKDSKENLKSMADSGKKSVTSTSTSISSKGGGSKIEEESEEIKLVRDIDSAMMGWGDPEKKLVLRTIRYSRISFFFTIEFVIRMVSCILTLIPVGTILSFVILVFRVVNNNVAENIRRFIGNLFLFLAGIYVRIDTQFGQPSFQSGCSLLAFTHCSNLDGFLISATCPVRHFAFGKKELFWVPFFSWMSLAVGGIPVDRQNQRKSVNALKRTTEKAARVVKIQHGSNTTTFDYSESYQSCCLVIAPEGTRSPTGQLLPFKKGAFHMWEQLKGEGSGSPIVPLVILGAYELYPPHHIFSEQGLVVVRYLKPIQPHEASTRHEINMLLRRRICEASMDVPDDLCRKLTMSERLKTLSAAIFAIIFDVSYIYYSYKFCSDYLNLSDGQIVKYTLIGSFLMTALLYIYFVFVVDFLYDRRQRKIDAAAKKNDSASSN